MDAISDRAHSQLILCLNVLKRIALRMSLGQLKETFNEAINLWGSEPTRRSHTFNDDLSELLAAIAMQMPRRERADAVLNLVTLPLAGTNGRFVLDGICDDISFYLPHDPHLIVRRSSFERIKTCVQSLITLFKTATQESGTIARAVQRFNWLYNNRLLTSSESKVFGKLLWKDVKSNDEVPLFRGFSRIACLWWPERSSGNAVAQLHANILKAVVPRFLDGIELDDDRLSAVWKATAQYRGQKTVSGCEFVDWTEDEAVRILDSVVCWWHEKGKNCDRTGSPFFVKDLTGVCLKNILQILSRVVIPRIKSSGPHVANVFEMVNGIQSRGFPTEVVLPALLRLRPEDENDYIGRMFEALVSNKEEKIASSLNGIFFWIEENIRAKKKQSFYRLSKPPVRLLNELAILAAHRRQPGLGLILKAIRWIIKDFFNMITSEFVENVTTSLSCLREETAYGSVAVAPHFEIEEIPTYRLYGARIAVLLHNLPRGRSTVTDDWVKSIASDPLPEVRACLDLDDINEE
ncbi:MAG: hypothetical protein WCH39_10780 [Schlesneria sp.]